MASLKGLSVKKIVDFVGREGNGVQCDVYYNGKKVGFFNDPANGGECDTRDIDKEVVELFKDYKCKDDDDHAYNFYGIEWAIYDLLELHDLEKEYKKAQKKGGVALCVVSFGYMKKMFSLTPYWATLTDKEIMAQIRKRNDGAKDLKDNAFLTIRGLDYFNQ